MNLTKGELNLLITLIEEEVESFGLGIGRSLEGRDYIARMEDIAEKLKAMRQKAPEGI